MMRLCGYADRFGVRPGETIRFHVSCEGPAQYSAEIVELVHGDTNPRGPGFIERPVPSAISGTYPGRPQVAHSGSYGVVPPFEALDVRSFTLQCWIWPTLPATQPDYWRHGEQAIVACYGAGRGFGLFIDITGRLVLRINGETLTAEQPLRDHAWHFVAASFDHASGTGVLYHEPEVQYALDPPSAPVSRQFSGPPASGGLRLMFAAHAASGDSGMMPGRGDDRRNPFAGGKTHPQLRPLKPHAACTDC